MPDSGLGSKAMKALKTALYGLAIAGLAVSAGCSNETGSFSSGGGGGSIGGGGAGGGGGGGAGGGGGGPPTVTTEPDLAYQLDNQSATLWDLRISGSASNIVFVADEDPFGTNPTGNEQIFAVDLSSGDITQLTSDPRDSFTAFLEFEITDNGSEVVFLSREDIVAGSNPGNVRQIFVAQTDGTGTEQVSNFAIGFVTDVDISGDGNLIVFQSTDDLVVGSNPGNVNQIFSITRAGVIEQITTGIPDPLEFDLSDDGSRIVYASAANPFGTNADFSREIFVINTDGTGHAQITDQPNGPAGMDGSFNPKISDDGDRIAFVSTDDHAGGNADLNYEVFGIQADGTGIVQITDSGMNDSGVDQSDAPNDISISGNGVYVAFGSDADLTGENTAGGHTIFWATFDGTTIGQILKDGRIPDTIDNFSGDTVHIINDGAGFAFRSTTNFAFDSTGVGEKIFTHAREGT